MPLEHYTLLLFLAGVLAGVGATILALLIPDTLVALKGITRTIRAARTHPPGHHP